MNVDYPNITIKSIIRDTDSVTINWNKDWFKNYEYMKKWFEPINIRKYDAYYDTYIKGIWGTNNKEGEDNMFNNEVLNLYYVREREKLDKKYKEIYDKNYNEHPAVKEYNDVVSEFETTLVELANKYNTEEEKVIVQTGYTNDYQYEIACDIKEVINKDVMDEKRKDLNDLKKYCDEVNVQLTLSDDLEYQVDVLKRYEILDKNGKINA